MAKKIIVDETVEEVKKLTADKMIVGTDRTLKALREGKLSKIYISANCPDEVKNEINIFDIETIELKVPNTELGTICKKPYVISILGVLKDED